MDYYSYQGWRRRSQCFSRGASRIRSSSVLQLCARLRGSSASYRRGALLPLVGICGPFIPLAPPSHCDSHSARKIVSFSHFDLKQQENTGDSDPFESHVMTNQIREDESNKNHEVIQSFILFISVKILDLLRKYQTKQQSNKVYRNTYTYRYIYLYVLYIDISLYMYMCIYRTQMCRLN